MRIDRVLNRPIGIIGLARSGLAAAKLLKRLGGRPFVSEYQAEENIKERVAQLKADGIPYEAGGHTDALLHHSEFIVVSPGVPNDAAIILKAEDLGIPIMSELEMASWLCDANIAAITGSNGKTTTTTLLGQIFKNAGYESEAAGNIGYPFSEVCDHISDKGWISLEVSSFQLERVFDFKPHIAVILNLTPDHLDRYGTFEEYAATKMRIAENMGPSDYLIINADDDYLMQLSQKTGAMKVYFSQDHQVKPGIYLDKDLIRYEMGDTVGELGLVGKIAIPGPHNVYNAMATGAAALLAGVHQDVIKKTFHSFAGVEHRLELVDTIDGVRFINDSKATNVDSVWYALQSVEKNLILIMGGKYKGGDLKRLNDLIRERVKFLILIGEATDLMQRTFGPITSVSTATSLPDAVNFAFEMADPGDTVMLSPACASFDMFTDFEHRGRVFKKAVAALKGGEE